jgi:hypothetical protein
VQGQRFAAQAEPVTDVDRVADFLALRLRRHPLMVRAIMTAEGLPLRYTRQNLETFAAAKRLVVLHPVTPPAPAIHTPGRRTRAGLVAALLLTAAGLLMLYPVYVRSRQRRMQATGRPPAGSATLGECGRPLTLGPRSGFVSSQS